ncbi:Spermatogenesis-Associated Protein 31A3 [Manis pentadactyla]|nr:Spermatogenesis-Associated Protein 31A3 [Manis pentadactyla]
MSTNVRVLNWTEFNKRTTANKRSSALQLKQNQIESQRALSSGVKRPPEVCSVRTSTHPEDSRVVAMLTEKWPNSPEIQKKLEQHLQERFIRHQWELPGKIQESVELKRLQVTKKPEIEDS